MAETATPAAGTKAPAPKKFTTKPERPDEDQFKKSLAEAEKAHAAAAEKLQKVKAQIEKAQPNKDSPSAKRRQELQAELAEIRKKQSGKKNSRDQVMEQIRKEDEKLKAKINEQKAARSRVNFKSVDEIDREIARLQKQVDSGSMKIVDEKKALGEISNLNKSKKSFAGFEEQQKQIDAIKAKIAELRKSMDDPESRAMSDRYTAINSELDEIRKEQDAAYKNLNNLRDERSKAHGEQQATWAALKKVKDDFYEQRRANRAYEQEAFKARKERQEAERKAYESAKRRQIANQKLEEASSPAYLDEILTTEGLIRYFDPSALPAKEETSQAKFAAAATRTVDDSGLKGMKVVKKDDEENYFVGTGGKKGKKNKKSNNSPSATPSEGKFNLSIGIIEQLAKINVNAPASQADVPAVVKTLQEKLEFWKKDQDRKTKENIEKAKKEIEKLEAESNGTNGSTENGTKDLGNKPAAKNQQVNGSADAGAELSQEKDAANDAAEELAKASIEEKEQPTEA
ncbi:hypothetical protein IWZ01DRAFT_439476 [Phyllosticta capitalensis]